MADTTPELVQYIHSLLNDSALVPSLPNNLRDIEGFPDIDKSIRNLQASIVSMRNGKWSPNFSDSCDTMVKKLERTIYDVNEAKNLFELFFETIPDATLIVSYDEFEIFKCNHAFEVLSGQSKAALFGTLLLDNSLFKSTDQKKLIEAFKDLEKQQNITIELQLRDGSKYHGLFSSAIIFIDNKKYILSVIKNITELKVLEKKLRKSEEIHRLLADNANDVIWVMDLTGAFSYISPSVEKLRGFTVAEIMLQKREELLCPSSLMYMEKGLDAAINSVKKNLPFIIFRQDMEQPCKDGTTVWTDLTVSGIYDKENQFIGMLGVSRDISQRRAMEDEIRRLMEIDRLTQLYNRLKSDHVLKAEIERSERSYSVFSIILLDIDNFKNVNDTYGHSVGDDVLKGVAQIILANIRSIDTASRWGGEEFMIIMPESDSFGGHMLAEKLLKKLREHSFSLVGTITASFGVAEFKNGITEGELLSRADKAMYEAKAAGKDRVCVF